jgi:hypothetical protein
MKNTFLFVGALVAMLLVAACEGNTAAKKDDRLGARSGVTVSSRDMSRVAPTRAVPVN